MNPLRRILQAILITQTRHPVLILFVAVGLAVLSIVYSIRNLDFQTGQKDLISSENRLMRLSKQIDSFDVLDTFVVVIEGARGLRRTMDDRKKVFHFCQEHGIAFPAVRRGIRLPFRSIDSIDTARAGQQVTFQQAFRARHLQAVRRWLLCEVQMHAPQRTLREAQTNFA